MQRCRGRSVERPAAVAIDEKALRGVAWTFFGFAADRFLGFATTIVLARLLVPHDFGLMTIGLMTVSFVNLFGDLGLGATLIVRQDLDRRGQGAILTMLIATGLLAAGIMAALAPLVALLFEESDLTPIVLALSGVTAISGVNWFYSTLIQRELEFRARFVAVTSQVVVNSSVAIPLALAGLGVWSLVIGIVVGALTYGIVLIALAPYRVRPAWDTSLALDLLRTGRGFILQGVTSFLQQNADYVTVGHILGTTRLGLYSTAYRIGELPRQAIADPVAKVTFPSFSRMRARGEDVPSAFVATVAMVAAAACPAGALLSGAADPFVHVVLGPKWVGAIRPIAVFGGYAAVRAIEITFTWLLNSVGLAPVTGRISVGLLFAHIPMLIVAAHFGGITYVAWAMFGYIIVFLCALAIVASRSAGVSFSRQWHALAPTALASAAAWIATRAVAATMPGSDEAVLVTSLAAGVGVYVVALWLLDPSLPRTAVRLVGRVIGRAPA